MDKRKRTPRWCVVAIVALLPSAMLACGCGTGPDSAIVETPSVVQRLLPVDVGLNALQRQGTKSHRSHINVLLGDAGTGIQNAD